MKANEAPEKIYRTTIYLDNDKGETKWKRALVAGAENIEYTRTDVFIKKAIEWISNNCYIPHSTLEEFRNYMKGE